MTERKVSVELNTLETLVKATINLDGTGEGRFAIGVPFLEHAGLARHGLIDLCRMQAICTLMITILLKIILLAKPLLKPVIARFARCSHSYMPMDEALFVALISGRPGLQMMCLLPARSAARCGCFKSFSKAC